MAERLAASSRHQYVHNGAVVYEWDQSLTEVNVYVRTPPGVTAKQLYCRINTDTLVFGLGNNDPYLDVRSMQTPSSIACIYIYRRGVESTRCAAVTIVIVNL